MGFCRLQVLSKKLNEFGCAHVAQLVERVLGKDEVISSILIMGSIIRKITTETTNTRR